MSTSRTIAVYHLVTAGVFFVCYFFYFIIFNRYHLIYQEQIQLFRFDISYFTDFLSRPGGLAEYFGEFLTQFFLFPLAGASIVTLAGLAAFVLSLYILSKHQVTGVLWAFVPVMLLAALHSYHFYTMAYTISLVFSLGFFAVFISLTNNKLRYFFMFAAWPLMYFITGGFALLTILLCFINELSFRVNRFHFVIALIFPVIALLVPYIAAHFIF